MTGPDDNIGPGNLKQGIREDYYFVSLSLSQITDLDIKKKSITDLRKKNQNSRFFFFKIWSKK